MLNTLKNLFLSLWILPQALVVASAFLAVNTRNAVAETVTQTVPGSIVLVQGLRYDPTDLGCQCINFVVGQWTDVPGTLSAIVKYQSQGSNTSKGGSPPYANAGKAESPGSAGYGAVPVGMNRIELGFNSIAGGYATRAACVAACDDAASKLSALFDSSVATVELSINKPAPTAVPTATPTPSPSEQLRSSVDTAIIYARGIKLAVPKKDLVNQKAIRKSLSSAGSSIVKFVKANKKAIPVKAAKVNLSELASDAKEAIRQALKLTPSTFSKDKAAVVKALNALRKAIAS